MAADDMVTQGAKLLVGTDVVIPKLGGVKTLRPRAHICPSFLSQPKLTKADDAMQYH